MSRKKASEAGRTLSKIGASKGGLARAKKLNANERKEIATKAAKARWEIPTATHFGTLSLGNQKINCAVLDGGTRLITQATFLRALGRSRSPKAGTGVYSTVDELPFFLQANALKSFIDEDLRVSTTPIFFMDKSGRKHVGYDATALPKVAEVYLKFRDFCLKLGKDVPKAHSHIVTACDILTRALAHVGIIALVDEATGYQRDRARDALAEILEQFISKELCRWAKTFPDEYFDELARLKRVEVTGKSGRKPQWVGKVTNNIVYDRLAPGLRQTLQVITPKTKKGNRSHKFFQRLTPDDGHPKLKEHLASVITLMRASNTWDDFKKMLDRALPKHKRLPLFDGED